MTGKALISGSTALAAGFGLVAAAMLLIVAVGGTRRPWLALGLLAVAVLAITVRTTPLAALGIGGIACLFFVGVLLCISLAGSFLGRALRRLPQRASPRRPHLTLVRRG